MSSRKRKFGEGDTVSPQDQIFQLTYLPREVLLHLLSLLRPTDLYNLRQTCRLLQQLGLHCSVWKHREVMLYEMGNWEEWQWEQLRSLNLSRVSVDSLHSTSTLCSIDLYSKLLEHCPRLEAISIMMKHCRCLLRAASQHPNNRLQTLYIHNAYRSRHFTRHIDDLTNLKSLYLYDAHPKLLRHTLTRTLQRVQLQELGIELFCSYRKVQAAIPDMRKMLYSLRHLQRFALFCTNDERTYYSLFKKPSRYALEDNPDMIPNLNLREFNLKWLDGACPAPDPRFWNNLSTITSLQINVDCSPNSEEIHEVLEAAGDRLTNLKKLRIGIYFQGHACCLPYIPGKLEQLEVENLCGKELDAEMYTDIVEHLPPLLSKTMTTLIMYEITLNDEAVDLIRARFTKLKVLRYSTLDWRCERIRIPVHRHL